MICQKMRFKVESKKLWKKWDAMLSIFALPLPQARPIYLFATKENSSRWKLNLLEGKQIQEGKNCKDEQEKKIQNAGGIAEKVYSVTEAKSVVREIDLSYFLDVE